MKKLLLILILCSCITGCSDAERQKELEDKNIAVVKAYIGAIEKKDTKKMEELLADNYTGYGPSFSDTVNKAGAIENWQRVGENLYEKIEFVRMVNIAAKVTDGPFPGDYVSDWATLRITYKDGRGPVHLNINAVYRVENSKITLSRSFYNEADVLRQLGYEFTRTTGE
jgi:limonene-1,2-epoxide hydrolase